MTDLTIDDLVSEEAASAAAEGGKKVAEEAAGQSTGEWFLELYDRMQKDDMLMPILFGNDAIPSDQPAPAPEDEPMFTDDENTETESGEDAGENDGDAEIAGQQLNAQSIAEICTGIENTIGDVRISQIRAMCENRPENVNQMIENKLQ